MDPFLLKRSWETEGQEGGLLLTVDLLWFFGGKGIFLSYVSILPK